LSFVSNRGVRVWPEGQPETFCIEEWRCRFLPSGTSASQYEILNLLQKLTSQGFDLIKTENLFSFDGTPGYSSAQG
jgi:isocitrate dehydrogenase